MRIVLVFVSSYMALFGLTLSESIDLAISNSPKVSISKSNIKYNEYVKDEATGAYHPTLQAGFAWQEHENPTAFTFSPSHNYNLSLKYNIFNGFSDYSTVSSKESEIESAKLEDKAVLADLKLSVTVAYTDYLKKRKSIKAQEEQLTSLTKQYDNTNVRYEQGIVAKNDLLLIDVEKLKAEQALIKAKSDFIVSKSNLENTIAVSIAENENIDDFDASVENVKDIDFLQEQMMKNRSEIKAMMFKSKSLGSQRDAITGNYLPKVNLEASHQINDQERASGTVIYQPKDQTSYGVNVIWDIYSGFRNLAMKKALLEKNNQQNFQLHQLKLDLKNQLIKAYEGFKVAKSAKYVASRAKESAKENYRITSDRYSYGEVDTLTLLVSQSNLTQAVNANNDAYYDLFVAYQTLQRIVSE
ncbi:TolC family type I secretion outer membrane protein [Sulfurimonas gotlandica GD1]|uniref:TolC family type I secretion outer membrane protein n=1 Tax=Sulfurimonas gotlandica (strain DSM 19862 / JCM 16533 / GD1) TaxID=929558 RepID=B6BKT7_SULGG|nr:TolC family protein [Sulfurimonas gotlandica]EDZ62226.1 outer membrane efflux protein [Sulfurimonas gotlandica GD1]EHP29147.1 TolC family type I secretion outer membrane protein [Sulfurimonas gotlandica GD1]